MSIILYPLIETLLRHGINALGAYLVTAGIIQQADLQSVVGGLMILGSSLWSFIKGAKTAKPKV